MDSSVINFNPDEIHNVSRRYGWQCNHYQHMKVETQLKHLQPPVNFLFPWHNCFVNIHVFVLYVILILFHPAPHLQFCYAILIGLFDSIWYGKVTVVKVYDHAEMKTRQRFVIHISLNCFHDAANRVPKLLHFKYHYPLIYRLHSQIRSHSLTQSDMKDFLFYMYVDHLPSCTTSQILLCHPYRLVWQYMIFLCNSGESVWSCWKENPRGFSCHYPSCKRTYNTTVISIVESSVQWCNLVLHFVTNIMIWTKLSEVSTWKFRDSLL
jgi:hypothetical protein